MKKVKANLIFVKIVLILGLVFAAGCDSEKDDFYDPEGTMEISMTKDRIINGVVYYPGISVSFSPDCMIYITLDNFFYCGPSYSSSMVNVGRVKGLTDIKRIPANGYTKTPPVEPKCGYVLDCGDGTYARIYVVSWLIDSYDEIIGAKIKYQYPF